MRFLKQLKLRGSSEFSIAEVEQSPTGSPWFKLSDTRGFQLQYVLEEMGQNIAFKKSLAELHNIRAKNLARRIKEKCETEFDISFETLRDHDLFNICSWYIHLHRALLNKQPSQPLDFFIDIVPYNVIVNLQTFEMTIIDPM